MLRYVFGMVEGMSPETDSFQQRICHGDDETDD